MERLAAIFKALSDRNRLAIFQTIRTCCCDCGVVNDAKTTAADDAGSAPAASAGEVRNTSGEVAREVARANGEAGPQIDVGNSVSDIASRFDLSLSTVSHHLKELKNAGLIICEKRGQWVYCRPNPEVLKDIEGFLEDVQP